MFNWNLFFILIAVCIPGILLFIPTIKTLHTSLKNNLPAAKKMPSKNKFVIIGVMQTFMVTAVAAAFGVAITNKVNLHAPFFEALANHQPAWPALQPQIMPALLIGGAGSILFLIAYYLIFMPRLNKKTVQCMKNLRLSIGFLGRVFYGGIIEEILFRWGLMTLFVWLGAFLLPIPTPFIFWLAILLSGLLFALGHLPSYLAFGCEKTPIFITAVLVLNLGAATLFGWLFWQVGLCAAILAHMLFHVIWYPFDQYKILTEK